VIEKIKADLNEYWVSWVGFVGLLMFFFVCLFWNPRQLFMVILCWVLIVWGMSIEDGIAKKYGYIPDEVMNEPYN